MGRGLAGFCHTTIQWRLGFATADMGCREPVVGTGDGLFNLLFHSMVLHARAPDVALVSRRRNHGQLRLVDRRCQDVIAGWR